MTDPQKFILLYRNGESWVVATIDLSDLQNPKFRSFIDTQSALARVFIATEELQNAAETKAVA